MKKLIRLGVVIIALLSARGIWAQSNADSDSRSPQRLQELEAKLSAALKQLSETKAQVESLITVVKQLQGQVQTSPGAPAATNEYAATPSENLSAQPSAGAPATSESAFLDSILTPDLGGDERDNKIEAKPELFVQGRFATAPLPGATPAETFFNFRLSRVEARWSGRISDSFGAGFEIQYHPANDGDPTQLINDAFLQYYPTSHTTLTGGQFVLPFGYDVQQSSADRESPERAMFVGYFFPGQRDRGVMMQGDFGSLDPSLKDFQYFVGVFNGNRFWAADRRQLNYNFRLRKRFETIHLAVGVSGQVGHQLLPPGVSGTDAANNIGVDVQYAVGRLGIRGEFVAGNMPSTLLDINPVYAGAFAPGRHTAGATGTVTYMLTANNHIYARFDQLTRDPVTDLNVRALNAGYFRLLGHDVKVGLDYQWKNHLSYNDDAVNTRLQLTWQTIF